MPGELSGDVVKDAIKEALKEWLNEQFARFGRWSAAAFGALLLSGVVYAAIRIGIILNR